MGSDAAGRLGNGPAPGRSPCAVRISGLSGVTAIGAGNGQAVAVREDSPVWAWGGNSCGGGQPLGRHRAVIVPNP